MSVEAQGAPYVENVTWSRSRVQFGTVHVPGSNNDWAPWFNAAVRSAEQVAEYTDRNAANLAWVDHIFRQANRNGARGIVIGIQADTWDAFFGGPNDNPAQYDHFTDFVQRLARNTKRFGRPVLLLNGDSHIFVDDRPLADPARTDLRTMCGVTRPVRNLRRITVNGSATPCHEWLRLSVDPASPEVFTVTRERFATQPGFDPAVCP